ncbi:glycoside hydrolase family 2 TIM barrel-domain containing protein [Pedobacter miscanthi]|uniref:glycoside hydrolase family 2 TIM barrel-domain containing protein n=1 Tax=Pedobacter miscanthi TaxID=2259170 RepID=UPI00292CEDAE|nr:glycoside hydrolase family 2 TIM barrel-domain containing protein [Pedobacter miscanthi]
MRYLFILITCLCSSASFAQSRWTTEQANAWYKKQAWMTGCNYQPASAVNQLEMFQETTFDPTQIDKELGWAQELGFNTMRVFLHHIAWTSDKEGFKKRLDNYLDISAKHNVKTILVFFDDCWNDKYAPGKQPEPKIGVHNSGWLRDPGTDIRNNPDSLKMLEAYVKDILTVHKDDKRILMWDLYNEPGNNGYVDKSLNLLKQVFSWAKTVNPSQPLTAGVWNYGAHFENLNKFQLENSDIITYHHYGYIDRHQAKIADLKAYKRPLVCTEYMARRNGSLFQTILPMLKAENVGAINWGFVSGKTNTIYAWDTPMPGGKEPELWFHDIFRQDKTPFSENEVKTIKTLNGKK